MPRVTRVPSVREVLTGNAMTTKQIRTALRTHLPPGTTLGYTRVSPFPGDGRGWIIYPGMPNQYYFFYDDDDQDEDDDYGDGDSDP